MMKNIKKHFAIAAFFALCLITGKLHAQTALATAPVVSNKKPVMTTTVDELAKLRSAVEANPNDLAAHEAYIKATGFTARSVEDDPVLVAQYEIWMKKFPISAAVPYSLGHAYADKESPKAKPWLLKAVDINPKFDKAYFDLWIDGERWGDFKLSASYLLKAKEADPKNADYAFYYASGFSNTDFEKYKKLSMEVVTDFPNTERGSQALYWLASKTENVNEKISIYEMQRKKFPVDKFSWTSSGMSDYFNLLIGTSPDKAVSLAQAMIALKLKDAKTWETNLITAKNIAQAQAYLTAGKAADAVAILDSVAIPRYSSSKEDIALLKAKALAASGKTENAYRNLLTFFAKEPSQKVNLALNDYGNKLGKDQKKVEEDIWYVRDTAAKQAPNFSLEQYYVKGRSSLSDYKGKVVLLTYWFPGCGPCRGEFPHFENVMNKFKGKDVVYLGINIVEDQNEYVLPFMKSSGYSFIPLLDDSTWKKGPLDNRRAAPVNFLIDQNGKIIFSNFRTDARNEATLEMMINSMLQRKAI